MISGRNVLAIPAKSWYDEIEEMKGFGRFSDADQGGNRMLEEQDAELFYQLFFPLLDFVNKEYRMCPEFETMDEDVDQSAQKSGCGLLMGTYQDHRHIPV